MAKIVKYISLTHTPSTHIINIPIKVVRDMNISEDELIHIEYDFDTKIMTLQKIKEN